MKIANTVIASEYQNSPSKEIWEKFYYEFDTNSSDIESLHEWAKTAMLSQFSQVFDDSKHQHMLEKARVDEINNYNLVIPIYKDVDISAKLIALKPGNNLPLHDHPGSAGAMMVVSGDVRVVACEKKNDLNHSSCALTFVENKLLSTGETSCFTKEQHNIHSLKTVSERAVLLLIHTSPFSINEQTYFFTASPLQDIGSDVIAQCVRVQAFQKFQ